MADAVQHAINDSRRMPNMVLTAHVHNYQRIEREIVKGSPSPFIVAGHGGYYHLHHFNKGVENGTVDDNNGAKLAAGEDKIHGYLTLSADSKSIVGFMTTIDKQTEEANPGADTFEYSAEPLFLEDAVTVSL